MLPLHRRIRVLKGTAALMSMAAAMAVATSAAHAQDQAPQEDQAEAATNQEIVVTGSRIQRGGFTAPTPVTAIGRDRLGTTATTNVGDLLSQLPSFRATSSPSATQTTPGNAVRSRVLELRSLGAQRNLVLAAPSTPTISPAFSLTASTSSPAARRQLMARTPSRAW